MKKKKVKI